ncbi:MAG TPA: DMT family transporter, partial [Candidatus Acidoferrum sp.]|nr:DMT family transporter [Candidatus Acidoferrum sp.]
MKDARAVVTVLIGATLLGSLGAWGRTIYRYEGDPMTVVTWRALIGAAVLAALLAAFRPELLRVRPRDLPFFAVYGFVGVTLNFWMYFSAVKYTTLAVAITLLYTYPAFVALLSALFLGERLTSVKLGAIAVTLIGSALVAQVYATDLLRVNLRGILFGMMTGLSMAAYSIFGKRAMSR